jgi:carboxyl-terminal processing protease
MNRRHILTALAATAALPSASRAAAFAPETGFAGDVDWLIDQISVRYAYLPERQIDLAKLRALCRSDAAAAMDRKAFLPVLEHLVAELHDDHITINSNNDLSPQLVPTGTEMWGEMREGRAWIVEVRLGGAAAMAGVRAGDEIILIDGRPASAVVAEHRAKSLARPDPEANNFALRAVLAGNHLDRRRLFLRQASGGDLKLDLPPYAGAPDGPLVSSQTIGEQLGYIRIENSLGDSGLVAAFDTALAGLKATRGLILDLRNTPSGGDSDIAEPILGRFIKRAQGYQRVFTPAKGKSFSKDSWVKQVKGRGPFTYKQPLVVLCGRWTGSMGEGMTIGLDGLKRSTTVGTRMAGLCGGTEGFTLPKSDFSVHIPTERLYHIDFTPRETWAPKELVDLAVAEGGDPVLKHGVEVLEKLAG